MVITKNQISLPVIVPAVMIYIGTLFQVGYFYNFGLEFLSTVGATDWLFAVMLLSVPIALFGLLIIYVAFGISHLMVWRYNLLQGTIVGELLDGVPDWFWLLLILWLSQALRQYSNNVGPWLDIVVLLWVLGFTALIWRAFEETEAIAVKSFFWLAFAWAVAAFNLGSTVALIGGRLCHLRFSDGHETRVVYMRAVADGHLYRVANAAYFTAKSEIADIKCEMGQNSMEKRMQVTFPHHVGP